MKSVIQRLTSTNANVTSLILRVPVGIILTAHAAQKLYGWFAAMAWKELASGWLPWALSPAT